MNGNNFIAVLLGKFRRSGQIDQIFVRISVEHIRVDDIQRIRQVMVEQVGGLGSQHRTCFGKDLTKAVPRRIQRRFERIGYGIGQVFTLEHMHLQHRQLFGQHHRDRRDRLADIAVFFRKNVRFSVAIVLFLWYSILDIMGSYGY